MTRVIAGAASQPRTFAGLTAFSLDEFVNTRWAYNSGQHTTILAPTDWGKTHLSQRLLSRSCNSQRPGIALVMKPRDKTVKEFAAAEGWRRHYTWPPPPTGWWTRKPPGFLVWPRFSNDPEADEIRLYQVMAAALRHAYAQGGRGHDRIVFADEAAGLVELQAPDRKAVSIERLMRPLWTRGRSLGVGMWAATQRPVDIPLHAYSQAQHMFLGNDPDVRGRKRFGEIGGVDPKIVERVTAQLEPWHWLYIRRAHGGPRLCVITPN